MQFLDLGFDAEAAAGTVIEIAIEDLSAECRRRHSADNGRERDGHRDAREATVHDIDGGVNIHLILQTIGNSPTHKCTLS